jgi:hypothetical protein
MGRIKDADRKATKALADVDDGARSQLRALRALSRLATACPDGGALAKAVVHLRDEHAASFVRFHVAKAERAVELGAPDVRAVLTEAIAFLASLEERGGRVDGELAALRARLAKLERGERGARRDVEVRPFFARYLVEQRRG